MTDETELKLELTSDGARVVEASSLLPGKPKSITLHSTYFDTPDRLLAKAGLSLRIRQSDGARIQTIKGDGAGSAGLFVRSEWERSIAHDWPMLDDATPIPTLLGDKVRDIVPIFEIHINRMIWEIQENEVFVEVALDRGEVIAKDRSEPICEIELELKTGAPSVLFDWARRIDAIAAVQVGVLSKAERGYRLREAMASSVKAEPISLAKDVPVNVAFQKIAEVDLRQFRLNETLIEKRNPDALHQARVSLRRLRSALTIFKPILLDDNFEGIGEELRWLVCELGQARDLDVVGAKITTQPLRDQLEIARTVAYSSVAETLRSGRARTLLINLTEWIADGPWLSQSETSDRRKQALIFFARDVLRHLRKKLKKVGNITSLDDEQRHKVRKTSKKIRYASEFFASQFGGNDAQRRHKRFLGALERLQNKLGALNDLAMTPSVLEQAGLGGGLQPQSQLSTSEKAALIIAAADAYDELMDVKRFWK